MLTEELPEPPQSRSSYSRSKYHPYGLILAPGKAAILPVAIAGFNTFRGVQIGSMSAAILIAVVPVVVASFFIQRKLVQGISGGAVKF